MLVIYPVDISADISIAKKQMASYLYNASGKCAMLEPLLHKVALLCTHWLVFLSVHPTLCYLCTVIT